MERNSNQPHSARPASSNHSPRGADVFSIAVPASSANLGCAFDCAAVALNLFLRLTVAPSDSGQWEISYLGPRPEAVPLDSKNLIARAMQRAARSQGMELSGASLTIENEIPVGVGLGSSAAAIVAGIFAGAALCGSALNDAKVLRLAAEIEGHPDNVSAALHGGFVVSARNENSGEVLALRCDVPADLQFVVVIPQIPLATEKSRAVLPANYSRADAVHNLQRAALLAAAFFSGGKRLRPELFRDRLHQPYRAHFVPGIAECLEFMHPSLLGIALSGSGSAVIALARENAEEIAAILQGIFQKHGVVSEIRFLRAANEGARLASFEKAACAAETH